MKYAVLGCVIGLAACDGAGLGGSGGAREFMVIGSNMSFETCRARGGLIIRDANTSMIACDPQVRREPQPVDEFNNPASNPTG